MLFKAVAGTGGILRPSSFSCIVQETSAGRNKLLAEVFLNIKATVMPTTAMVRKTAKRAITVFFFKIRLPPAFGFARERCFR